MARQPTQNELIEDEIKDLRSDINDLNKTIDLTIKLINEMEQEKIQTKMWKRLSCVFIGLAGALIGAVLMFLFLLI